jgi:dTDP-4-amino-4,6-dideoxygalactose transaminase
LFRNEEILLKMKYELEIRNIFPRRYFYPTLSSLHYVDKYDTKITDEISCRVLSLPLYFTLSFEEQDMIARILLRTQNN